MLNIKPLFFLIFLVMLPFVIEAQQEKMAAALNYLQKGELDNAKVAIDDVVLDVSTANDGQAWYIRGFVYKTIYNTREKSNKQSPARIIAVESFKKSNALDTSTQNVSENVKSIKYIVSTFFNDVKLSIDSVDYEIAVLNFEKFKLYYPLVDPSKENLKQREIEFKLALATLYTEMYKSKRDVKFFNLTKSTYSYLLTLDPNNISANYNMGILYYNQAVDLINDSDYGIDFKALNEIQDNAIVILKQALPFAEKAHELEPKRRETLVALSGIYFTLNEVEKYNSFQQKLDEIEKEK